MGTRYYISVKCPECGHHKDDVYYAPTCGFVDYTCKCGHIIDMEKYTGISYEEASNRKEIETLIKNMSEKYKTGKQ